MDKAKAKAHYISSESKHKKVHEVKFSSSNFIWKSKHKHKRTRMSGQYEILSKLFNNKVQSQSEFSDSISLFNNKTLVIIFSHSISILSKTQTSLQIFPQPISSHS